MTKPNIQVPLPPYKVVFPEEFRTYIWDQQYKWYKSLGINGSSGFHKMKLVNEYQPRERKPYHLLQTVELGLLPQDQK